MENEYLHCQTKQLIGESNPHLKTHRKSGWRHFCFKVAESLPKRLWKGSFQTQERSFTGEVKLLLNRHITRTCNLLNREMMMNWRVSLPSSLHTFLLMFVLYLMLPALIPQGTTHDLLQILLAQMALQVIILASPQLPQAHSVPRVIIHVLLQPLLPVQLRHLLDVAWHYWGRLNLLVLTALQNRAQWLRAWVL